MYVVSIDSAVRALDANTGQPLWSTNLPASAAGGISLGCGMLLVGYGYQDFESAAEPLTGGLTAYPLNPECTGGPVSPSGAAASGEGANNLKR